MQGNYLKRKWNTKKSNFAILFVFLYCLITITNFGSYKPSGQWGPFRYDQFAYYSYLPAIFIYKDIDFGFVKDLPENNPQIFWPTITKEGKLVNKVTMGMSILFSPFFLMAHGYAKIVGEPLTGYSMPYRVAMFVSALFYILMSLLLMRKLLNRYFIDNITSITLIALFLGTNYFYYAVHEVMMSHAYSFFLYLLFIYLSLKWHEKYKLKYLCLLGVTVGIIALVRPTNLLIVLFLLLYQVNNFEQLILRFKLFFKKIPQIFLAIVLFMMVIFPQLWWWKVQTGHWLFFSYGDNEKFYWTEPAIWKGLFSYTKGWFVYTPMMLLAVLGIIWVKKYAKDLFIPILLFSIINVYIVLSWWSWWYGGSFGLRAFVEFEVPLSFCFASLLTHFWYKRSTRYLSLSLVGFFLCLNLFQTFQYKRGVLRWSGMTKEAYWFVFDKIKLTSEELEKREKMIKEPNR